ncbi:MAG: glycosyltransferase family 4 protein [Dechloromonas sp.]|uniref:Glycosyltransferase family 4 protein n=1 Tax=Candidatus Dechloromonas phosphorivorans TaxID=2899244 RepID=A0A9D7LQK9_9RHOO|nr:glycosyltransferase family 4 protein [Candidatus Dechloromonas phosphorivorans]
MRVLYIHLIGAFGGASRSLFETLRAMPKEDVEPVFLTTKGSVTQFFSTLGPVIETKGLSQFDNTKYSYYRGARWLVLLRELWYLPFTISAIRQAKKQFGHVDLLHLNEFTGLATLWIAKRWFSAPAIVHVRSVARVGVNSWRTKFVNFLFHSTAKAVVAIDQNVRASLPPDLDVSVIHNSFAPAQALGDSPELKAKLQNLRPTALKVGFVGNLLRVKGIEELLEAARILCEEGEDLEFVIVGDDAGSSKGLKSKVLKAFGLQQNVRAEVEAYLDRHGLHDRFHLVGFTANIGQVYSDLDVLCFPSHYDAPGRPIFEAAFFRAPSIVAVCDPKPDTLVNMKTGIAIAPKSVAELAGAIRIFARDRELCKRMGQAAHQLACANFDVRTNASKLLAVYKQVLKVEEVK